MRKVFAGFGCAHLEITFMKIKFKRKIRGNFNKGMKISSEGIKEHSNEGNERRCVREDEEGFARFGCSFGNYIHEN